MNNKKRGRPIGGELFYITPIILGGNPHDNKNKIWLTRKQHIEAVRYWNGIISNLQKKYK
ncbi:hypothetical protein BV497_09845 [Fulvimonas soli]|nr:hypothetical protein BV497_09845 [Fulvimonas soli]